MKKTLPYNFASNPNYNIANITTLWAVSESGIGGLLHATGLPLTGIVVGGLSVIFISLIAMYSEYPSEEILKSLILVLCIKLLVSPHTSWQAYVAVGFQGFLGALLLQKNRYLPINIFIFSVVSLLESAVQKVFLMVLIFGSHFLEAIDKSMIKLSQAFGINSDISITKLIFIVFIGVHLFVGVIIGSIIPKIPRLSFEVGQLFVEVDKSVLEEPKQIIKSKNYTYLIKYLAIFALIIFVYLLGTTNPVFLLIRSLLVTLLLAFVVGPILQFTIKRFIKSSVDQKNLTKDVTHFIKILPFAKNTLQIRLTYAMKNFSGLNRFKMIFMCLVLPFPKYEKY